MPPPFLEEDEEVPRGPVPYLNYRIDLAFRLTPARIGSRREGGWGELLGDRNPIEKRQGVEMDQGQKQAAVNLGASLTSGVSREE